MQWMHCLPLLAALALPAVVYGEDLQPLALQPSRVDIGADFTGGDAGRSPQALGPATLRRA